MEADRHHAIGGVKCLFHTITVVHVNVDVEHPIVVPSCISKGQLPRPIADGLLDVPEKLENAKYDILQIAKEERKRKYISI